MSHGVLVGGFSESQYSLDYVAETAEAEGFADDFEVLTLREAMGLEDDHLRSILRGGRVLTHSAGVLALPSAQSASSRRELPKELVIVAGPEPRFTDDLRRLAKQKTQYHLFAPTPHRRRDHLRVVAGNAAELLSHPFASRELVSAIGNFSTTRAIEQRQLAARDGMASFMMKQDVFYPPAMGWQSLVSTEDLRANGLIMEELPGAHDELLVNPSGVLQGIKKALPQAV